jgi:integrase
MTCIAGRQMRLVHGPHDDKTRKLAEAKLKEFLRLEEIRGGAGERLTVAAVVELYLQSAVHRYAPRSFKERKLILNDFCEDHGERLVNDRDCLPFHLTSWLDARRDRWKSDWTLGCAVAVIQRPFNWAVGQRLIAANPFRGVRHRVGAPRRPMTDEEFKKLLTAAQGRRTKKRPTPGQRFTELLHFLWATGARPGEAARLKWSDVKFTKSVIVIGEHKTSRTQRQPKPRIIPLTPSVVGLLVEIRKRNEPGEFVFRNHRGTLWNRSNLSLRMRRAREKANVPADAKLYGLRHAFGVRAIVNAVDIKTLAELMGHSSTRMTEHYLTHLAHHQEHLAAAMRRVSG